ncbi:beta-D-glucuronidase [compost metagenome]
MPFTIEIVNKVLHHYIFCVVMWNVANEPASYEDGAYEYFKPLIEQMREEDRSIVRLPW